MVTQGLMVKHSAEVVKAHWRDRAAMPGGWYIFVWNRSLWQPILDLVFLRQVDATRAAASLTSAGLSTFKALRKADQLTVKQIACQDLQW